MLGVLLCVSAAWSDPDVISRRGHAPPLRVGKVDAALLFMLHPAMRDFVREEQNFTRPMDPGVGGLERKVLLRQRQSDIWRLDAREGEAARLSGDRLRERELLRQAAYKRLVEGGIAARDAYARATALGREEPGPLARRLAERVNALEAAYWQTLDDVEGARREASRSLEGYRRARSSLGLLQSNLRQHRLGAIMGDIVRAVDLVRRELALDLVVNAGHVPPRPVDDGADPPSWPGHPEDPSQLSNGYRAYLASPAGAGHAAHRRSMLEAYLTEVAGESNPYRSTGLEELVVGESIDATRRALELILEWQRVPRATIGSLVDALSHPEGRRSR